MQAAMAVMEGESSKRPEADVSVDEGLAMTETFFADLSV